jgi:transcriptional regulator with XRE-family HTH domain
MEYMDRIKKLEREAGHVNISLHALCRRAGVPPHHISRWLSGQVNPTVRVLNRDLGKLEGALADIERGIFDLLAAKFAADRPDRASRSAA